MSVLVSFLLTLRDAGRSRASLQLEVLALRHQLHVLKRLQTRRLRLTRVDRLLWVWFASAWPQWRDGLVIVKPETVITWQRRGFRLFWTWKSCHRGGRRNIAAEVRTLAHHVKRESPMGCAADSRRTAEAWYQHLADNRRNVHASPAATTVANVAHVPGQPRDTG
jgi:hypothetical protein